MSKETVTKDISDILARHGMYRVTSALIEDLRMLGQSYYNDGYFEGGLDKVGEIDRQQEEIRHLKACKEFESNLQTEIIDIGMPLMPLLIRGKTYSVTDAWLAIQNKLRRSI